MKSLAVLAALMAITSAAVPRLLDGDGGDLFKRQDNCRTADSKSSNYIISCLLSFPSQFSNQCRLLQRQRPLLHEMLRWSEMYC
ncbi:uncharacterized protein BDZ83DRAFT_609409 [Colletotrichum acutatum]|uniref:Uncharacterized protein n=1 Tax=Glomerella acutata TaxID=27357 RepID=A0AAD8UTE3_GLOAC|nr:uncharacterized protein BDZ83DRAFT_609409 [Colletotrichum acutatum]KAK1728497.1 hypothetical protein BDZ83DRAFT_609409 [Colletotrichum acutatum]